MDKSVIYSVVIPVFNEEQVILETYSRLTGVMQETGGSYELIFVNDGSRDRTGEIIDSLIQDDDRVRLLDFSRNFGHQIAITAGMDYARGEAVVIIDGDLQDPPEVIPLMIEKWQEGYEVVYGRRTQRKGESWWKTATAALFYRVLGTLTKTSIPFDTGDFRLMDRKVCDAMRGLREKNRFVRGLVSWVGFRQTAIEFVREERFAGESKYPLKKMLHFAWDGISAFSYKPLQISLCLGSLVTAGSLIYITLSLLKSLLILKAPDLGNELMAGSCLLDGLVLMAVGILGEYVSRICDESRGRPLYILRNQKEAAQSKVREVRWRVQ
ncbi:MAG: glycosyltransferase family 2 protein [Deltaproteobacteria bacterium]